MSLITQDPNDRKYIAMGLRIIGDFGATIAVPVVLFVLVGQWLDGRYGYAPWFTVCGFVLSALLSGKMIYDKARKYGEEYKDIESTQKNLDIDDKHL